MRASTRRWRTRYSRRYSKRIRRGGRSGSRNRETERGGDPRRTRKTRRRMIYD
jgi:hypothetical protein